MSTTVTVADVIALPLMQRARPEILSGQTRLTNSVRWVHVAESPRTGHLIDGHELLLTTGRGLQSSPESLGEQIDRFAAAEAAGLVVELGTVWSEIPQEMVDACRRHQLPLIQVREELRFVELTEAVHTRILAQRSRDVAQLHSISETFWSLTYNGAPPEQIVTQACRELDRPVVLEDRHHRVVVYAEGHTLPSELLREWEPRSRNWAAEVAEQGLIADPVRVSEANQPTVVWECVDIQARGHHWGRLWYRDGLADRELSAHILRHAAMALAIDRLSSTRSTTWNDLIDRTCLERLAHNRFTTVGGQAEVLSAAGFDTVDRYLSAFELRCSHTVPPVEEIRTALAQAAGVRGAQVLVAQHPQHPHRMVCALSTEVSSGEGSSVEVAQAFAAAVEMIISRTEGGAAGERAKAEILIASGLGGPVELGAAVHRLSSLPHKEIQGRVQLRWLRRGQAAEVITDLHGDVRAQAFAESTLGPLLIHDARNDSDLLSTLRVLVHHPTSRSAAAAELHVSRTALYSRIATIERLLQADLSDGHQFFALALALKTYLGE
ncbi:Purine catabolism regulatory protein [Corynebacterium ciconiae DSM 44920]|uniref:PucR family transcriptional regulator n=1 Tax=Corynebacterium ciconiae TaxID=227319 RepID=UPI000374E09C|nr:PucR family transcriptional regulator [Corynebacterium ciconiae]WKD61352.1 Purine catabolism regulatory protein [Corynebacterium ciconiae DSM 44920]